MSRTKSAADGMMAFFTHEMSAFWSLRVNPVADKPDDRDPVATAEKESFFWRAERREPAW